MTQIRPATLSPDLQALLDLPDEERHQALEEMSPEAAASLVYDWHFWARPDQLAPEGKWFLWLLLGGRGSGKTRAGSEWIRDRVTPKEKGGQGKARRIALVGESAADVRDIMVEGEAGILAVSPPWFRPHYEPSKRRLTWPNGAVATCYSGDKPALLRGPSHDTAWCLIGSTRVSMADGTTRRIDSLVPGDVVHTRQGPRRVRRVVCTSRRAQTWRLHVLNGRNLFGTGDHRVWIAGRGWVPIADIEPGDLVCALSGSDRTTLLSVTAAHESPNPEPVYDITVEGGEFFANGILVHNCDESAKWRRPDEAMAHLELGLRLGDDPRGVITTTPRPIPLIRRLVKDEAVHVTHSITYDNIANLAQRFIERVIQRHEGTRLGRQELRAEILEDTPGALWSHEIIEAHRISHTRCPYDKIVIGVDPQAHETDPESRTHDEEAGLSETGIVVCARGARDHHGYVLWDYSGYYSPRDWAEKAKAAFFKFHANWVVAEVNHGGAMVVYTIRSVDDRVAVKPVRASLGKRARAEPIASLYEQGRVHHVGQWAELEDQMCTWTDGEGWHADRMDALVWALTELLIEDHQDDTPFGEYDATRHTLSVPTGQ